MEKLSIRETQIALLEVLGEFDRVCREHNLRYSLAAGTLLGAVRHKGFIPWDDDCDVYMPRPDYEKFIRLVSEGGVFPEYLTLSKDRGRGTYYSFVKILDTRYPLKCSNHIEVPYMFLDIFPIDGAAPTAEERAKQHKKERRWVIAAGICQWYTMDRWWGCIAYIIGFWFYILVNLFVGRTRAVRKMNEYAAKYPYETSDWAVFHCFGRLSEVVPKDVYENYCELEFEGKKFMAVENWDMLLEHTYGDYMKLPPEKKRRSRHYIRLYRKDNQRKTL